MMTDNVIILNSEEEKNVTGGEAITIAAVAAVLAIGILAIVVWKIYTSSKGEVNLPGGFKLKWDSMLRNLFRR